MKHHLTLITSPSDKYQLQPAGVGESQYTLYMDTVASPPHLRTNFWQVMDSAQLAPRDLAVDLYRIAATVYAADLGIPRVTGFDRWTRQFALHVPVSNVDRWRSAQPGLEQFLAFLTGDRWEVEFRQCLITRPPRDERAWKKGAKPVARTVSLFSGGLDSFVGAVELTKTGSEICLVGHYGKHPFFKTVILSA